MAHDFNGTTATFNVALIPLLSVDYDAAGPEVPVSGAADGAHVYECGVPGKTTVVEVVGSTLDIDAGDTGALAIAWNSGGSEGSMAAAVCTKREERGGIDGPITTKFTFRPNWAAAVA